MLVLAHKTYESDIKDPSLVTNDGKLRIRNPKFFLGVNGLSIIPDIRSSHAILLACVFCFVYRILRFCSCSLRFGGHFEKRNIVLSDRAYALTWYPGSTDTGFVHSV